MKRFFSSFRGRLTLLSAGGTLLLVVFWQQKLGPTVKQWEEHRAWRSAAVPLDQLKRTNHELTRKLEALDAQLTTSTDPSAGWRHVLELLGEGPTNTVSLAGIAEEHVFEAEGAVVRTLPVSLQGNTADLVNTVDALERSTGQVHLITMDMRAKAEGHGGPRKLVATLYLQTLSR